jgi:Cu(I)/Ag(I) efflux system membrane protein CusA/SilA
MTAGADVAGLLPILYSTGTGSEVMSRLAAPMVGGMITAITLTLLVVPTVYMLWKLKVQNINGESFLGQ